MAGQVNISSQMGAAALPKPWDAPTEAVTGNAYEKLTANGFPVTLETVQRTSLC